MATDSTKPALGIPSKLNSRGELVKSQSFWNSKCKKKSKGCHVNGIFKVDYLQRIIYTSCIRHTFANFYSFEWDTSCQKAFQSVVFKIWFPNFHWNDFPQVHKVRPQLTHCDERQAANWAGQRKSEITLKRLVSIWVLLISLLLLWFYVKSGLWFSHQWHFCYLVTLTFSFSLLTRMTCFHFQIPHWGLLVSHFLDRVPAWL